MNFLCILLFLFLMYFFVFVIFYAWEMYFDQYKDKFNQSKGSEGTIISVIKKFRKKQYFVHKRMQNDDFRSI